MAIASKIQNVIMNERYRREQYHLFKSPHLSEERFSREVILGHNLSRDCLWIRRTKTSGQDAL